MPAAQSTYGQGPAAAGPVGAPPLVPFSQAAHRGLEPGPVFTFTPGTAQQTFGPVPLPAQGYLRRVLIEVVAAGGTGGTPVGAGDYPFNVLNLVRLQDTNGAPVTELGGFNLMLANTYGGYAGSPDPRNDPDYSSSASNPVFELAVPVEIAPTGLGALANQSASASYRFTIIGETSANIWTTPPTTIPTFTIKVWMDYWTLPAPTDMLGRPQMQTPPFHGVAQYWSQYMSNSVNSGYNTTRINRVGNLIRTLVFVGRVAGVRSDVPFPDPYILSWDSRNLRNSSARTLHKEMREMVESLSARDTGVCVISYSYGEGRHVGDNSVNSWLATVTATRLELDGSSSGSGTLDILVNDVSVAETVPAARAVETSATGFHPTVASAPVNAQ